MQYYKNKITSNINKTVYVLKALKRMILFILVPTIQKWNATYRFILLKKWTIQLLNTKIFDPVLLPYIKSAHLIEKI